MKSQCHECKQWFDENDLDRDKGQWICRKCEDEVGKDEEFGGVF